MTAFTTTAFVFWKTAVFLMLYVHTPAGIFFLKAHSVLILYYHRNYTQFRYRHSVLLRGRHQGVEGLPHLLATEWRLDRGSHGGARSSLE